MKSRIVVKDYRVFYDGRESIGGSLVRLGDELVGVFGGGPFDDDEAGQHPFLVRTRDGGGTWTEPELFIQRDPEGRPFTNHYNAMNGQFVSLGEREWLYVFGHFGVQEKIYRILALHLEID